MSRPNRSIVHLTPLGSLDAEAEPLEGLSARELLAELARVEDSLRRLSALAAEADRAGSYRAQRPLRQREHAIVDELTARRHRRGLIAAPLAQERPADRTPPPWA
jgi:hypothetical protein